MFACQLADSSVALLEALSPTLVSDGYRDVSAAKDDMITGGISRDETHSNNQQSLQLMGYRRMGCKNDILLKQIAEESSAAGTCCGSFVPQPLPWPGLSAA